GFRQSLRVLPLDQQSVETTFNNIRDPSHVKPCDDGAAGYSFQGSLAEGLLQRGNDKHIRRPIKQCLQLIAFNPAKMGMQVSGAGLKMAPAHCQKTNGLLATNI